MFSGCGNLRTSSLSRNSSKSDEETEQASLCTISKQLINYVRYQPSDTVFSITELAALMNVKKRRIYDILNVLEGMGYIKKTLADSIVWLGHRQSDIDYEQETRYLKHNLSRFEGIRRKLTQFNDNLSHILASFGQQMREQAYFSEPIMKMQTKQIRIQPFLIIKKKSAAKSKRQRSVQIQEPAVRKLRKLAVRQNPAMFSCKVCRALVNFEQKDSHKKHHS